MLAGRDVLSATTPTPKGRYLTRQELHQARNDLQQWMMPEDMDQRVEALSAISDEYFFIQADLEFIRDAHTAADFAKARQAQRVRLYAGQRPDFELDLGGGATQLFEITEADLPGRKRGDEYRATLGEPAKWEHVEQEEMIANAAAIPGALKDVSDKKAAGGYEPSCALVVMVNIPTYGACEEEVEALMEAATQNAGAAFREVWIMWAGELYRPWPRGWNRPPKPEPEPHEPFDLAEIFGDR
jgi:hypothetical protein